MFLLFKMQDSLNSEWVGEGRTVRIERGSDGLEHFSVECVAESPSDLRARVRAKRGEKKLLANYFPGTVLEESHYPGKDYPPPFPLRTIF